MLDLSLTKEIIRKKSITPDDQGCMELIEGFLTPLGFECKKIVINQTSNFIATKTSGVGGRHFLFLGHTDVVPQGSFDADIKDGILFGRGTNDMKGAIASFLSILPTFLSASFQGSISILLTSDEEGDGKDGIIKMIPHLPKIDFCLIGEPSSYETIADTVKYGSRGSLNNVIQVKGHIGHVAYHDSNPIHYFQPLFSKLVTHVFDHGTEHFIPTKLQMTSVDVGNLVTNLIPETITCRFNIRFNDIHTGDSLVQWISAQCETLLPKGSYTYQHSLTNNAYYSDYKDFVDVFDPGVRFSTAGATSDGRHIYTLCPTFELGCFVDEAHCMDEKIAISDLEKLCDIYLKILKRYFS